MASLSCLAFWLGNTYVDVVEVVGWPFWAKTSDLSSVIVLWPGLSWASYDLNGENELILAVL